MEGCKDLIHPFQHDPGVSQRQRVMNDLLSGPAQIDGRQLADILDYFTQLSRHINYYHPDLSVSDWQPFFQKSIPFSLAAISKFKQEAVTEKLGIYQKLFRKNAAPSGLQLLVHYVYYSLINSINTWHLQVEGSELPVAFALETLIKDKLRPAAKAFISYANAAVKWYCIKPVNWQPLAQNEVWDLDVADLYTSDVSFKDKGNSSTERISALYQAIYELIPAFLDVTRVVAGEAAQSIEQSLLPLKQELQKSHPPHLALLFAFLKLFRYLQDDLNGFTRKHLDFFYKQVLQLKAREATPDKSHLVFEIQNQLDNYLLRKGLLAKDGKDNNKAEVFFALDDELVLNKTQATDKRTLFLNYQTVHKTTYTEGIYMAPNAGKADGLEEDFEDDAPKSFATLGAKKSKYIDPEHKYIKPYPSARLGFILASPVLLLNEGTRTVSITLSCELTPNICKELNIGTGTSPSCCDENDEPVLQAANAGSKTNFAAAEDFYARIITTLNTSYYYISQELISQVKKKGVGAALIDKLTQLLTKERKVCYCPTDHLTYERTIRATGPASNPGFENIFNPAERALLADFFKPRKALKVQFSGENEWLAPGVPPTISLSPPPLVLNAEKKYPFSLKLEAVLEPDKPAVTFYNAENLTEDFNTTLPLVKIELDDKIKLWQDITQEEAACCLEKNYQDNGLPVSLYHFFRNVTVKEDTSISVKVCGLKNFVVQNDESLQNVNGQIYPFGTRPKVIDFDIKNPLPAPLPIPAPNLNLVGPNFYIGSKEVFCKKWDEVYINLNWKDKPTSFNDYYNGYLVRDNYHDCINPADNTKTIYGLNECDFQINLALLENGSWVKEKHNPPHTTTVLNPVTGDNNRLLFASDTPAGFCTPENLFEQTIKIKHAGPGDTQFNLTPQFKISNEPLTVLNTTTRDGFLRINLQNQDFLHKDYSYVLARQMMAFGRYPDLLNEAIYMTGGVPQVFDISIFFGNIGPVIVQIAHDAINSAISNILDDLIQIITDNIDSAGSPTLLNSIVERAKTLLNDIIAIGIAAIPNISTLFLNPFDASALTPAEQDQVKTAVKNFVEDLLDLLKTNLAGIEDDLKAEIRARFDAILDAVDTTGIFSGLFGEKEVIIPKEPWTPIIEEIAIDYTATATKTDIDLIHLYPYEGTYKREEIEQNPTLFPVFCDEGTLFLGLQQLVPGSNLNLLFQLAEATADSESEREEVTWAYLDNNHWKALRPGFEVLDDATDGLTTSGIVKLALPANMTNDNTILPAGLHWIKAAIPLNSRSVSETIGIHTQAIQVTFTNEQENDKLRLAAPLPAGSIAKLKEADVAVSKVMQPYDSFGGHIPEAEGHFYVRVSEQLRHKNRAIQKFDYERLALEAFHQLYKVKCINHSFALNANVYANDFPVAPGYVLLAVIPDLTKLKAAQTFEPRVPVSLLEKIRVFLLQHTSPFVRLRIMNPRYEKIHFCLKIKLYPGKDENFFKEKLKQDLSEFLAPWAVGQYDKLSFGQCIYRSDVVRFLKTRHYLDYILELIYWHEADPKPDKLDPDYEKILLKPVCPKTPRSILIAGDIDVCIQQQDCPEWQQREPCKNAKIPVADYCNETDLFLKDIHG